ncbi:hypothetical protein XELAEV_18012956mg [Xenopus laevis]|uniref:Uncharacterized protein n=1 Tax=Xenopus laevis TaxID=8355 RepID=A0A974DQT6_XENLA|nr:hypothetical protein XELAEV_18012956mg [Xenopus laevis]
MGNISRNLSRYLSPMLVNMPHNPKTISTVSTQSKYLHICTPVNETVLICLSYYIIYHSRPCRPALSALLSSPHPDLIFCPLRPVLFCPALTQLSSPAPSCIDLHLFLILLLRPHHPTPV